MPFPASSFSESVENTIKASNQLHEVINGSTTETVTVESGTIPSLRKALTDNFYFISPTPWVVSSDETVFNQLRTFTDGTVWWAPTATTTNPITMTADPYTDSNWTMSIVGNRDYINEVSNTTAENLLGGVIYPIPHDQDLQNGDTVPTGVTFLRVNGEIKNYYPLTNGLVSSLTDTGATIGTTPVAFKPALPIYFHSIEHMLGAVGLEVGKLVYTGKTKWIYNGGGLSLSNFTPLTPVYISDYYGATLSDMGSNIATAASLFKEVNVSGGIVCGNVTISDPVTLIGGGKSDPVKMIEGTRINISSPDVRRIAVYQDYQFKRCNTFGTYVNSGSHNYNEQYCGAINIVTQVADPAQYGLGIDLEDIDNFSVYSPEYENISAMGDPDGAPTGNGFCGGVYLFTSLSHAEITNPSSGRLLQVKLTNIYTTRNPSHAGTLDTDADGIRSFVSSQDPSLNVFWDITIDGIDANKVQKSVVKLSGTPFKKVGRITVTTGDAGGQGVTRMDAVVRSQWSKGTIFDGAEMTGVFRNVVNAVGPDQTFKNFRMPRNDSAGSSCEGTAILVQKRDGIENENLKFVDFNIDNCSRIFATTNESVDPDPIRAVNPRITKFSIRRLTGSSEAISNERTTGLVVRDVIQEGESGAIQVFSNIIESTDTEFYGIKSDCKNALTCLGSVANPVAGIKIRDWEHRRDTSDAEASERLFDIRQNYGGAGVGDNRVSGLDIEGVKCLIPLTATLGNSNTMIVDGSGEIEGITTIYYDNGVNTSTGATSEIEVVGDTAGLIIKRIIGKLNNQSSFASQAHYSVVVEDNASRVVVNEVNSDYRGAQFKGNSDNIAYSGVTSRVGEQLISNISSGTNINDGGNNFNI